MKRAYLGIGPEGSGTNLLCSLIANCGPTLVPYLVPDLPDQIVLHRSLPDNHIWPDIEGTRKELHRRHYQTFTYFITRDVFCTIGSQIERGYVADFYEGLANVRRALGYLSIEEVIPVSYESLRNDGYRAAILRLGSLSEQDPGKILVRDENAKYWE